MEFSFSPCSEILAKWITQSHQQGVPKAGRKREQKLTYSSAGAILELGNVLRHRNLKFTASDRWGQCDMAAALDIFCSNRSLPGLSDLCLLAEGGQVAGLCLSWPVSPVVYSEHHSL